MPKLYALLIGIDAYLEHTLPDGSYYPRLQGCVRDIRHVQAYLTSVLKLPANRLLLLTATNGPRNKPKEAAARWPTYANMVDRFQKITAMAQPGDQVYIHYSGHGGRATTIYADLKGASGVDEALVPVDIGDPRARYLRDVEIHKLIQDMVDKGLVLTVIFDSCHSGGATRAATTGTPGAVARGIATVDKTPRPTDSLVGSPAALAAAWAGQTGAATRAVKPASGWLLEPKGYTLLAACRANESAYEYPFDGTESNGALTYWLLDALRQASPNYTYKMLHDRILAKVHSQFEMQTPMLQGEADVRVFGSDRIPPVYAVPVMQVDVAGHRVQVNAGEVHGIQPGAQFAIFALGSSDLSRTDQRVALAEATEVAAVDTWAKIVDQRAKTTIEQGAPAVLLNVANQRLQRGVVVAIADPALKQQVESAIRNDGKGFIALAGGGVQADFQVVVNAGNEFELQDPGDKPILNLRPAVQAGAPGAVAKVVERLVHLAKYRNVQALDVPDAAARQKLQVRLTGPSPASAEGGTSVFRPGEMGALSITNTQQPNPADPNDPARVLNITILDLQADWGITQIYPAAGGNFEPLDPGATIDLPLEALLDEGQTESVDVLKVFATRATTNFRWLEMPALDQPPPPGRQAETSSPTRWNRSWRP